MNPNYINFLKERFFEFSKFGVVGVLATLIHFIVAINLMGLGISILIANLLAYCTGFLFSFCGHYFWSFKSTVDFTKAASRFLAVSFSGFIINNIVLLAGFEIGVTESVSLFFALLSASITTYLLSRHWAFQG